MSPYVTHCNSEELIRYPPQIYWSESGELVTLACDDSFYVLRYNREEYVAAVQSGNVDDDGVEAAFEVVTDISET